MASGGRKRQRQQKEINMMAVAFDWETSDDIFISSQHPTTRDSDSDSNSQFTKPNLEVSTVL